MKRRLGIAQALLNDPKVLIVDEPTAGLDPEERVRFRNLLSELAEDKIVILSTHIVGDIEAVCEDIAIINEGRVIYNGTVDALLQAAEGRVFTMTASKRELPELKRGSFPSPVCTPRAIWFISGLSRMICCPGQRYVSPILRTHICFICIAAVSGIF